MVPWPPSTLRVVAAYLRLRQQMHGLYEAYAMDHLLARYAPSRRRLDLECLERSLRVAERAAPWVVSSPNTCLFRALSRYAVLVRFGHSPSFVLGMRDTGELPAHAWVEVEGRPFLESGPPPFKAVYRYSKGA